MSNIFIYDDTDYPFMRMGASINGADGISIGLPDGANRHEELPADYEAAEYWDGSSLLFTDPDIALAYIGRLSALIEHWAAQSGMTPAEIKRSIHAGERFLDDAIYNLEDTQ